MFERFTEAARRALFFSRYAASHWGDAQIAPEHLLLGLLRVQVAGIGRTGAAQTTTAATLLDSVGIHRDRVESRLGAKAAPLPTSVEIPFTASTKRCLTDAADEADRMGVTPITTGHLLLGLLQADGTDALAILRDAGLTLEDARRRVAADVEAGVEDVPPQ